MRTKLLFLIALICMVSHAAAFAGGDGTFADPYQIEDVTDLQNMKNSVSSHYILVDDIDASITSTWNSGAGFEPVGTAGVKFSGSLRGNGYEISNLTINRPTTNGIGIFGYTEYASLDNITLINADITGQIFVGGIVGYSDGATITASHVNGTIEGTNYAVGGIAGRIGDYGMIYTSSSDATVIGAGDYTGGLVGLLDSDSSILRSWSYGEVDGTRYTGGLVGYMNGGEISRSFSQADVNGTQYVGGLVGYTASSPTIDETYAAGAVTGSSNTGGLIGGKDVTTPSVSTSYWDTQTTGQATSIAGTGKTTAQMLTQSTYAFWDFNNNWKMLPYPVLNPGTDFFVYPESVTIARTAPPTIHAINLDFYRYQAASYSTVIATDDSYMNQVFSVSSLAPYPMVNLTRSISLEAGTYYMRVQAKDSGGNVFDTVETTFTISQSFDLGSTSIAGVVSEVTSGALSGIPYASVQLYNDTFSDTYNTGSNGYYQFVNLAANSTYYLKASKNGYEDSTLNIVTTVNNVTTNRNLFLQKDSAPNYIMPHYVRFTVRSLLGGVYEGVLVTVYEGNSATPLFTQTTGSDGAVGFELSENIRYRLTLYSESDNINTVYQVTPTKSEYNIYVSLTGSSHQDDAGVILYGMHIDGNELNVTWQDTSGLTSLVEVTIKNRDDSIAYYLNSTDSDGFLLQEVNTSENLTYIVELKIQTAGLDETFIRTHILTFESGVRPAFNLGFSAPWQSAFLASLSLIFLAVIFGSGNAHVGAILVSLGGLFHIFVTGWIPASVLTVAMVFIAVILSVVFYMRKGEAVAR